MAPPLLQHRHLKILTSRASPFIGDKFSVSLGGSQAPPSFWKVPGLPRNFPRTSPEVFRPLPRKFSHCGTQQQSRGSPEVSQTSPEVPQTSPEVPRTSPEVSPFLWGSRTPSPDSQKLSLINSGFAVIFPSATLVSGEHSGDHNHCPGQSAEMCWRIFVAQIWRIFPGIFLGGIFLGTFYHKKEEKKSGEEIRKKNPAAQK